MSFEKLGRLTRPEKTGRPVRVSNDGQPEWKAIGVTIAWELVAAQAGADTELPDGTPVKIGQKAIRFGTVLVKLTSGPYAGQYAPFVDGGANGQGTLTRDDCGILDQTVLEWEVGSSIKGLIEGGGVYRQRLNVGAAPLPALAAVVAAMPRLRLSPVE